MDSAEIIRTVRERAGLSRRELERRIGATYGHVTKWEDYGVVPRLDKFLAVLMVCDHECIIKQKSKAYYGSSRATHRRKEL